MSISIHTQPQTHLRLIIPRSVVIQSGFFIEFFAPDGSRDRRELVGVVVGVAALFDEGFAVGEVEEELFGPSFEVGDEGAGAQVVGVEPIDLGARAGGSAHTGCVHGHGLGGRDGT